jgi:hypothetical protein
MHYSPDLYIDVKGQSSHCENSDGCMTQVPNASRLCSHARIKYAAPPAYVDGEKLGSRRLISPQASKEGKIKAQCQNHSVQKEPQGAPRLTFASLKGVFMQGPKPSLEV